MSSHRDIIRERQGPRVKEDIMADAEVRVRQDHNPRNVGSFYKLAISRRQKELSLLAHLRSLTYRTVR
jgi:hypothetical protein